MEDEPNDADNLFIETNQLYCTEGIWRTLHDTASEAPEGDEAVPYWAAKATSCQVGSNIAVYHSGRLLDAEIKHHGSTNACFKSHPFGMSRSTCYEHWDFYKKLNKMEKKAHNLLAKVAKAPGDAIAGLIPPERALNRSKAQVVPFILAWYEGQDLDAERDAHDERDEKGDAPAKPERPPRVPSLGNIVRRGALLVSETKKLQNPATTLQALANIKLQATAAEQAVYAMPGRHEVAYTDGEVMHTLDPGWGALIETFAEQALYCPDKDEGRKALLEAKARIDAALVDIDRPVVDPSDAAPVVDIIEGLEGCPTPSDNPDDLTPGEGDALRRALEEE